MVGIHGLEALRWTRHHERDGTGEKGSRVKSLGFRAHSHGRDSRLSGPQVDKTSLA